MLPDELFGGINVHSTKIAISLYTGDIPEFAEAELERLYQNIYSSLTHFRLCSQTQGISTYLARRGDEIISLFLFKHERNRIEVLNEGMTISNEEVRRFANFMFAKFPDVGVISFHAVVANIQRLPFPVQHYHCLEDIVLQLPATEEEYRLHLGKSTRSYISRYMNRLKRSFPSMRHEIHVKQEITLEHVETLASFNKMRMQSKSRVSTMDDAECQRITALARSCGLLSVITIDGKIRAGLIIYQVGRNYFLETISHDPDMDPYRLGTLCCYLSIEHCIRQGGEEFHFLWGRSEYKYRLLGVQRNLDSLILYRSPVQVLRHGRFFASNAGQAFMRWLRIGLHDAKDQKTSPLKAKLAVSCLQLINSVKQFSLFSSLRQR